jgi:hypothetical protein
VPAGRAVLVCGAYDAAGQGGVGWIPSLSFWFGIPRVRTVIVSQWSGVPAATWLPASAWFGGDGGNVWSLDVVAAECARSAMGRSGQR